LIQRTMFGMPVEELRPASERGIVPLDFESHAVRMIMIKGVPWWVASDVCRALTIANSRDAIARLDPDEKGVVNTDTPGGPQETTIVNQFGVFQLILTSRKPEAKRFKRWLTHEVLPSLQRTGSYSVRPPGRVTAVAKRIKSDMMTAKARCETIDINKHSNKRLASEGAVPRDFALYHGGRYRGFFGGMTAKQLREQAGMKGYQTPLDRMGGLLLSQSFHAMWVAERKIKELQDEGKAPTFEEQAQILEDTARYIASADFEKLGTGFVYGLVDDPQRGLVFDVVRAQLPA
jgi:prophage antirepressor-like protein